MCWLLLGVRSEKTFAYSGHFSHEGSIVSTVPALGRDVYPRRAQVSLYIILCCCDQAGNAAQATSAAWVETFALSERTPSYM